MRLRMCELQGANMLWRAGMLRDSSKRHAQRMRGEPGEWLIRRCSCGGE